MRFLGVDFGWVAGASGLCCLELRSGKLELLDLRTELDLADVQAWVDRWATQATGVAVDAPTIIKNLDKQRSCDLETHHRYGRMYAGAYPANLSRPFASRTVGFGDWLLERGFGFAPTIEPGVSRRFQIEVYPHPAICHLFDLQRILRYKKGTVPEKALALSRYRSLMQEHLRDLLLDSSLAALPEVPSSGGRALKECEDQLDAVLCAYVAAHWWLFGSARNDVLGDGETGFIVVPHRRVSIQMD